MTVNGQTSLRGDNRPLLLSIALGLIFLIIWGLLYNAQFLEYDENYGNLLSAFMLSTGATIWLGVLQWIRPIILRASRWPVILFLLFASPVTVILVVLNYMVVFGHGLKL